MFDFGELFDIEFFLHIVKKHTGVSARGYIIIKRVIIFAVVPGRVAGVNGPGVEQIVAAVGGFTGGDGLQVVNTAFLHLRISFAGVNYCVAAAAQKHGNTSCGKYQNILDLVFHILHPVFVNIKCTDIK